MMKLKLIFSKWTQVAGLLLIGGALAWFIKLVVIVSTNGRIINTGAAALLMQIGLLMLVIGSTGIGYRLSINRPILLRTMAIILSPVLAFGPCFLLGTIISPLFQNSRVWYVEQEAPIALAVIVYLSIGGLLYRSYRFIAHDHTTPQ
jgi:hypothetical protein